MQLKLIKLLFATEVAQVCGDSNNDCFKGWSVTGSIMISKKSFLFFIWCTPFKCVFIQDILLYVRPQWLQMNIVLSTKTGNDIKKVYLVNCDRAIQITVPFLPEDFSKLILFVSSWSTLLDEFFTVCPINIVSGTKLWLTTGWWSRWWLQYTFSSWIKSDSTLTASACN